MHKGKELLGCVFRNVEMGVFSNCRTSDMSFGEDESHISQGARAVLC